MGYARDGVSRFRPRLLATAKVELLAQRSECFYVSGFRTWCQSVSHVHQQPKKAPILRQPPGTANCLLKNLQFLYVSCQIRLHLGSKMWIMRSL